MNDVPVPDAELIARYDTTAPRYTSYPTAAEFREEFGEPELREQIRRSNAVPIPLPLSLYVHIPFCDTVCFYCACNRVITANRARAESYLQRLFREIAARGEQFDRDRVVDQLHWGGGTPTFLSRDQMRDLMRVTAWHFSLRDDDRGDYSVEIDPRRADDLTMAVLRDLGFNRVSLGVQDLDPEVQEAVNRRQSEQQTRTVIEAARREGFRSVNVDLIYGLPRQSVASFGSTLDRIIEWNPDRLAVFNYAHLPGMFKTQRRIREEELPAPAEKLEILALVIERLTQAGYVYIGMDHFARPGDELAVAQREGGLHRNFQGFSSRAECDLVGLGVSAISKVHDCYAQNVRELGQYQHRVDSGELPVMRGFVCDADDRLRREVISELICHGRLDLDRVEREHHIGFHEYFARECRALEPMARDGLLRLGDDAIEVLPAGRLLIRNICMTFDRYRGPGAERFSRAI